MSMFLFAMTAMFGYFLTWIPTLTEDNWRWWVGSRLFLQFGSGLWVTFSWSALADINWYKLNFIIAACAALICFAPLLDFIRGPVSLTIKDVAIFKHNYLTIEPTTWQIHRFVVLTLNNGVTIERGRIIGSPHAIEWEEVTQECREKKLPMQVKMLRHQFAPLRIQCIEE